jgi:hypothetical protein
MTRTLHIASGISVVFTTLAFGHIVYHNTVHMVTKHGEGHLFAAVHTILAVALGGLSLLGAYSLLTGGRGQNSN